MNYIGDTGAGYQHLPNGAMPDAGIGTNQIFSAGANIGTGTLGAGAGADSGTGDSGYARDILCNIFWINLLF